MSSRAGAHCRFLGEERVFVAVGSKTTLNPVFCPPRQIPNMDVFLVSFGPLYVSAADAEHYSLGVNDAICDGHRHGGFPLYMLCLPLTWCFE